MDINFSLHDSHILLYSLPLTTKIYAATKQFSIMLNKAKTNTKNTLFWTRFANKSLFEKKTKLLGSLGMTTFNEIKLFLALLVHGKT